MKRDYVILALLSALVLSMPVMVENVFILDVVGKIGIFTILAVGLNLIMGYAGQISLGHAAFFGLGAYGSMVLTTQDDRLQKWLASFDFMPEIVVRAADSLHAFTAAHMWLAALLAALFTGVFALVVAIPTLRLKGHYLAMATLGFGIIMEIVYQEELELTGGISGARVVKFTVGDYKISPYKSDYYYLVWAVTLAVILLSIHLVYSRQGRALRAIHADELAASTSGVPAMKMKVMVFALGAVFASLAGTLYAHLQTHVSPTPFGFMESVKIVIMVVVGGMGSIWGPVLGAALLYSLPQFLTSVEQYEMAVFGLILILVMMLSPKGLAGISAWIWEKTAGLVKRKPA